MKESCKSTTAAGTCAKQDGSQETVGVRDAGSGGGCEGRLTELGAGFAEEVMLEFRT